MITKHLIIFTSLLFISSCSLFINKIDDDLLHKQSESFRKVNTINTYCKKKSSLSLVSENNRNQKIFKSFLSTHENKKFTYADKVVLWSLVQMNIRPDLSSPTSKIQFFIKVNNRTRFFHIYSKTTENSYPYLKALETILKVYKGNYSLEKLANILDSNYPNQIYVTSSFSNFLKEKQSDISKNNQLKRYYIRGDETLQRNERIRKQNISRLIYKYLNTKRKDKYTVSNYLFTYKRNNLIQAKCNYDMGLYSSSIYLIHKDIIKSNSFGIREDQNLFLADTTQAISSIQPLNNTIYIKGNSQSRSPAMCEFNLPLNKNWDLWLLSSQSRDPGQHLFHLIEYGLQDMSKINQIDSLLRFSRHLFLKNPIRLILESERSNPTQLNELLKLNMPIYNADKLARIWGHYKSKKNSSFIIDQRRPGKLTCK